jgi:DNA-binding GntR family transcriptional regulator
MLTPTESLASTQLRRVIAERLRTAIHTNELKPGEWLRQEILAQKFGVSQTPVREALQDLVGEGLAEHVPYRGIRVLEFQLDDLVDLYACRAFMESRAARHAAQNITPPELKELRRLLNEMERHRAQKNWADYRRLNREFHQAIYTASRHKYLIRTLNQMWSAFPTMMLGNFAETAAKPVPQRGASNKQEHQAIIAALEEHDGEQAEQSMRRHIEESAQKIAAVLGTKS